MIIEVDWSPNKQRLRSFGFFALPAFVIVGLIFFLKNDGYPMVTRNLAYVSWSLSIACPILACSFPRALLPLYWLLTAISIVISRLLGLCVLALFFFLIITPISLIFKLCGRDALRLKPDANCKTFWRPSKQPGSVRRYFNQY
ncbi:MAG: hypothetical protein ACON4O_01930 [Lentimonas sp.]